MAAMLTQGDADAIVTLLKTGQPLSDQVQKAKSQAEIPSLEFVCMQFVQQYLEDTRHNLETLAGLAVIDRRMVDKIDADFVAGKLRDQLTNASGQLGVAQTALANVSNACGKFTSVRAEARKVEIFFDDVATVYKRIGQR